MVTITRENLLKKLEIISTEKNTKVIDLLVREVRALDPETVLSQKEYNDLFKQITKPNY